MNRLNLDNDSTGYQFITEGFAGRIITFDESAACAYAEIMGFNYLFATWCGTAIYSVSVSWIAVTP